MDRNNGFEVLTDWTDLPDPPNDREDRKVPETAPLPETTGPVPFITGEHTRVRSFFAGSTESDVPPRKPDRVSLTTGEHTRIRKFFSGSRGRNRRMAAAALLLAAVVIVTVLFVRIFPFTYVCEQRRYDATGLPVQITDYRPDGTISERVITDADGMRLTVHYTYEKGLCVKEESQLFNVPYQERRTEYRNGFAERITVTDGAGTLLSQESFTLDTEGPVSCVVTDAAGEVRMQKTYTYTDGYLTALTETDPADGRTTVTEYRYEHGRLVQQTTLQGEAILSDTVYGYNADGQLLAETVTGQQPGRYTYLYEYQTARRSLAERLKR